MRMVQLIMKYLTCCGRVQSNLSAQFGTTNGLRQGDVLGCLLFNVALEKLYRIQEFKQEGPTFINRYNFWHTPMIWT